MKFIRGAMLLAAGAGALAVPATAPQARSIRAKPAPAVCAEARRQGKALDGCPRPEADQPAAAPSGTASRDSASAASPR